MLQIDNCQESFKLQAPPVSVFSRASHHYHEEMWQLKAQVLIKHHSEEWICWKICTPQPLRASFQMSSSAITISRPENVPRFSLKQLQDK